MYDAMLTYQKTLEARGALDWGDVPRRLWHYTENGQAKLPEYDVILVDESYNFV